MGAYLVLQVGRLQVASFAMGIIPIVLKGKNCIMTKSLLDMLFLKTTI